MDHYRHKVTNSPQERNRKTKLNIIGISLFYILHFRHQLIGLVKRKQNHLTVYILVLITRLEI